MIMIFLNSSDWCERAKRWLLNSKTMAREICEAVSICSILPMLWFMNDSENMFRYWWTATEPIIQMDEYCLVFEVSFFFKQKTTIRILNGKWYNVWFVCIFCLIFDIPAKNSHSFRLKSFFGSTDSSCKMNSLG